MNFIIGIYLFVVFKFAPTVIDNRAPKFWRSSVSLLNNQRSKTDGFYLSKIGRLYIRDPHSYPMKSHWTSSGRHPFCWKLK